MSKKLKSAVHWIQYVFFSALGILARRLSEKSVYRMAHNIGDFLYETLKLRRKLVEKNLERAFPEKSPAERAQIAREVYHTQAINLVETLRMPLIRTKADAETLLEGDLSLIYEKSVNQGKGCLLVSAHFGNWETLALCGGLRLKPVVVITKAQSNKFIDRRMNEWRTLHGNRMVGMKQAPRECIRALRSGEVVCMLSDQSGPKDGYFMPFLNQDASVFLGAAVFALRCQVPLITIMPVRIADGKYRLLLEEIPTDDLTSSDADVKRLAERYIRAIESYIRRYPAQWFWLHNRWKRKRPLQNT
ncbi:lipid A biosynthesis acyltransferase [Chloroherpeton thalassium ATCC 35110]|uniref:Lipid A biosynthesis acyltransferase n=1 Tax=Chloroherpeton thalassium (strain ATCC 35110 / GB-78) TaxID=517418 RepID=B3QUE3_CHLT3|nr:lysophospholipid acyltransferase family protein [Chloroherpeton thalassium]ACF14392.1 lipid A biosynthesis acyltransferase [Chloroherpeton thalassium ATCC 35110]